MVNEARAQKTLYGGRQIKVFDASLPNFPVDCLIVPADAKFNPDEKVGKHLQAIIGGKLQQLSSYLAGKHGALRPCDATTHKISGLSASNLMFCNVPPFTGDNMKRRLVESVKNCLAAASKAGMKTVAIPDIGKNYPGSAEAESVLKGIVDFHFSSPKCSLQAIVITPSSEDNMYHYCLEIAKME